MEFRKNPSLRVIADQESGVVAPKYYRRQNLMQDLGLYREMGATKMVAETLKAIKMLDGDDYDAEFANEQMQQGLQQQAAGMIPPQAQGLKQIPTEGIAPVNQQTPVA
jgi:hypothetical protein